MPLYTRRALWYTDCMNKKLLAKINAANSADTEERLLLSLGFAPFKEGDIAGLSPMAIYKARGMRTSRMKKADGTYTRLYAYASPEGAEGFLFAVINAEKKLHALRFAPLYYRIYFKRGE